MAETKFESVFDVPLDPGTEAAADAAADAEIEAGLGVAHERVRDWLLALAKGDDVPPPVG